MSSAIFLLIVYNLRKVWLCCGFGADSSYIAIKATITNVRTSVCRFSPPTVQRKIYHFDSTALYGG